MERRLKKKGYENVKQTKSVVIGGSLQEITDISKSIEEVTLTPIEKKIEDLNLEIDNLRIESFDLQQKRKEFSAQLSTLQKEDAKDQIKSKIKKHSDKIAKIRDLINENELLLEDYSEKLKENQKLKTIEYIRELKRKEEAYNKISVKDHLIAYARGLNKHIYYCPVRDCEGILFDDLLYTKKYEIEKIMRYGFNSSTRERIVVGDEEIGPKQFYCERHGLYDRLQIENKEANKAIYSKLSDFRVDLDDLTTKIKEILKRGIS